MIPGFRLGAVATEPISPGALYLEVRYACYVRGPGRCLQVPWRMIISEDSIGASEVGAQFKQIRQRYGLGVGDYLLLYLLHERFR